MNGARCDKPRRASFFAVQQKSFQQPGLPPPDRTLIKIQQVLSLLSSREADERVHLRHMLHS